ncbi:hypothetical protein OROHE_003515 [Orobanche hederae]
MMTSNSDDRRSLVDVVFSWSLKDALNKDVYKGKVDKIPSTFSSVRDYKKSFVIPLIEETHADFLSNITKVPHAPTFQILDVKVSKGFKPPKALYYDVQLRRMGRSNKNEKADDLLQVDDLIVLTDNKPRYVADLNRPNWSYTIASIAWRRNEENCITILSSKQILPDNMNWKECSKRLKLFVVHITNLKTNIRIWNALHWEGSNINVIQNLLKSNSLTESRCSLCSLEDIDNFVLAKFRKFIGGFKLDDSQEATVVDCIAKSNEVPNIDMEASQCDTYGLGDIVIYGNADKMKIHDHKDLLDIFLKHRVSCFLSFLSPFSGWRSKVAKKMMRALELLRTAETSMTIGFPAFGGLPEVLSGIEVVGKLAKHLVTSRGAIYDCLELLKDFRSIFRLPDLREKYQIRSFCLKNATLVFCTASSSIDMHSEGMTHVKIGLRHAVLIGDERQLPAMVQSKICEKADFGRSLFERLVQIGHKKLLLKVQYKMHPSIRLFPNKQFYNNMILDGSN